MERTMVTYIALLRAINLAGRNKVAMSDLRDLLEGLGMRNGRTLLQSGNLVFQTDVTPAADLERTLEEGAEEQIGLRTDFLVRTVQEWQAIIAENPFPDDAERDPSHLLVTCLKASPGPDEIAAIEGAVPGREAVLVKGREAYIYYPEGIGRSKLTIALIEKKLGTRGTGRNWNTVLKLGALAESLE
jgi:uncharacterized protein (DUF1697 family)